MSLTTTYLNKVPYYPDVKRLIIYTLINAIVMTVAITAFVLYVPNVALMTTLIVLASLIGAGAFIYSLMTCVLYVNIEEGV